MKIPLITTQRLILRLASQEDIPQIIKYYIKNKSYLTPFYPMWPVDFFTQEYWQNQVESRSLEFVNDLSIKLFIFPITDPTIIIGSLNFSNIVRLSAHFCNVGYSLAEAEQGKGYMTEALKAAIQYVFTESNLHRIMANYMPHNQRSGALLKRLGFVVEGYAKDYLLINGKWQDHILTSLTNYCWQSF
ncbi:MAG: ribosomal protein S5-alanine N-acetyltransferase [Rhizonema sp. NSF051]|nr:ribosomal protein S5-alanine N-acetyltransferase [Rhizonema sp. NSF051]